MARSPGDDTCRPRVGRWYWLARRIPVMGRRRCCGCPAERMARGAFLVRGARLSGLTPPRRFQSLWHMPLWAVLVALIGGTAAFGYLGTRTFTKRVLN